MKTYRFFIVFLIALTYALVTLGNPVTNSHYTLCATNECINAEILEAPIKPSDTTSLIKAKVIFAQCKYKEKSETFGMSNLNAIVNSYGGWPIIMSRHEWNERNLTWQNVSTILHRNKLDNGLYTIEIFKNVLMSNSNVIYILEPKLSYSRDVMIHLNNTEESKKNYISNIVNVASNLIETIGRTVKMNKLTQDALEILYFEMELANLTIILNTTNNNDLFIPLTIQQLQEKYDKQHPGIKGKIDWHSAIQELFASERIPIEQTENLIVPAYTYLSNLVSVLERTPSHTIVNFMIWSLIKKLSDYIKPQRASARIILSADDKQLKKNKSKWKKCINTRNLDSAISHEYVKKYISLETVQDITEISTDIINVVRQQIRNITWMDEPTKKMALEKLEYMKQEFFKPDWNSDEAIDRYYKDLNVDTNYLDNIINIMKFEKKKLINSLRTPIDNKKWFSEPTTPHGYYNIFFNSIVFTAALLQSPTYDRNRIPLMNYGTLGVGIGHNINLAFDKDNFNVDKNGNIVQTWTQNSIDIHNNLSQCYIDQYNKYLVPGLEQENVYVNGQRTMDENTVDATAIVAAFYAYKNRKARLNETELRLQGLEQYSEDQLFFLIVAQFFCASALPEKIKSVPDDISVNEIRIRGSFSNSREFSESYNCPVGTPMNPEKKCAFWF
ncbi:membrane metallo-endopeptidase-like 1 isoform X2 [Pseudomyrmex gracilis]|uniref:membrane metallo-endopeptidase-like 1 isoform X2 n=1 Tax=Pseudomyrmex gracilis TaxID=219809 RepID=UPI000995DE9C|nr:membrane metallo-endopeptidase-like 1 isoform X2 [Pseudomyrmex gracilis]